MTLSFFQHIPTHDSSGAGKEVGQGHWIWGWENLRTRSQGAESKDRYSLAASKLPVPSSEQCCQRCFCCGPGTANLLLKQHIGPTFCHSTKAFQDREAVVACPRAGDPLKVITCLVLPTAGRNPKLGFEGGQTPLKKRAPRRGFHNP